MAREYGVNEKTIRDIWTGRTWYDRYYISIHNSFMMRYSCPRYLIYLLG